MALAAFSVSPDGRDFPDAENLARHVRVTFYGRTFALNYQAEANRPLDFLARNSFEKYGRACGSLQFNALHFLIMASQSIKDLVPGTRQFRLKFA